jgi:hypothetical protein
LKSLTKDKHPNFSPTANEGKLFDLSTAASSINIFANIKDAEAYPRGTPIR